ncbi:alpha/beta fold hydrolase [Amycolatopsis magusensis]|uniref:alpha/beta fold hydrolase n=1 Tax=Amycolatopsis magusensis TaxID=882444 RepID=UPI003C30CED0
MTGTLRVDGATLHYDLRGDGPPLLLIPGGSGGAASVDTLAEDLATDHRVVTYDPRGMSRSTLDDPRAEQHVTEHADDAARLLGLLAPGRRARVFGSSSGAIVALHLLTSRPELVERVVAHEPPVVEVLPDAAEHRAWLTRVGETFRTEGLRPAMAVFAEGLKKPGDPTPKAPADLPPQAAARAEQTLANLPYFVGRIVPSFMSYTPDTDRLRALSARLVLAAGQDSPGELTYRPAAHLAEHLGTDLEHFPGGHIGLTTHPTDFAERLRKLL